MRQRERRSKWGGQGRASSLPLEAVLLQEGTKVDPVNAVQHRAAQVVFSV